MPHTRPLAIAGPPESPVHASLLPGTPAQNMVLVIFWIPAYCLLHLGLGTTGTVTLRKTLDILLLFSEVVPQPNTLNLRPGVKRWLHSPIGCAFVPLIAEDNLNTATSILLVTLLNTRGTNALDTLRVMPVCPNLVVFACTVKRARLLPLIQCAAVRTCVVDIKVPPHRKEPLKRICTIYGAFATVVAWPPTIRSLTCAGVLWHSHKKMKAEITNFKCVCDIVVLCVDCGWLASEISLNCVKCGSNRRLEVGSNCSNNLY